MKNICLMILLVGLSLSCGKRKDLKWSSQVRNGDYALKRTLYLDELFEIETDFDSLGFVNNCNEIIEEAAPIENILYTAFERDFSYSLFSFESEESETYCVSHHL